MQFSGILTPQKNSTIKASPTASTATAAIGIGSGKKFLVTCVDASNIAAPFHMTIGDANIAAPTVADHLYLPNEYVFSTGSWTHVRIFNPNAGTVDVYVSQLSNT